MLLIVSKMVFLHKEGSRGRPRGSRFVWVIMCVRPTLGYLHRIHLSYLTQIQTSKGLKKFFLIPNQPNEKTSRKQKKFGLIFFFNSYFSEFFLIFQGKVF